MRPYRPNFCFIAVQLHTALYKNVKTRLFWSLDLIGPFMIHVLMPFMTQNFMGLLSYIYKHEVEHGPEVFSYYKGEIKNHEPKVL